MRISVVKTDDTVISGDFAGIDTTNDSIRIRTPDGRLRSVAARKIRSAEAEDAPFGAKIRALSNVTQENENAGMPTKATSPHEK